jgi:gamma-glutamyltranspeptidase/glutathione hydrolase
MSFNILAGLTRSLQTKRAMWVWVFSLSFASSLGWAAYRTPTKAPLRRGIVAADNELASRAGAEVLARGGNAVDAAVATALAVGVVSPSGSGLGGGGFLVYWSAKDKRAYALDFRETAPAAATRDMYIRGGKGDTKLSQHGGLAVAIPGEPAGLALFEQLYGKLGLARSAEPAIRLAREGYPASAKLVRDSAKFVREFSPTADDPLRAIVLPGGKPLERGQVIKNPELSQTLQLYARGGAAAFYKGEVARAILDSVKSAGGLITEADLAGYKPIWREPIEGHYRGRLIYAVPPPGGGATTIQTLQILDARPPLTQPGSSATYHALGEAMKHAFADRAHTLGDPAFVQVPTRHLIDPAYAKELAGRIQDDKVGKPDSYGDKSLAGAPVDAAHDHGTSHLCVADADGNVVALTTTVNLHFGSKVVAGRSGVILNDEMDDFSIQPGVPNAFGLIGAAANAVAPGKRPASSMTPLIVMKDGKPEVCAGGSGGPMIVSETVQTVVNAIDFGMDAEAAISSPRIHAQWVPDVMIAEETVPADVVDNLRKRGHKVIPPPDHGAAQMLIFRADGIEGASDPRKGGLAAVQ